MFVLFVGVIALTKNSFVVDGNSMLPTLESGQYLVVNRFAYQSVTPERGDLVVFRLSLHPAQDIVKRVIALPGETIEFRSTQVYINGTVLDEPYLNQQCVINHCQDSLWQLGDDDYFVLGDNRNHSSDSRFFGAIHNDMIIGEVLLRYYPFSKFGYPG